MKINGVAVDRPEMNRIRAQVQDARFALMALAGANETAVAGMALRGGNSGASARAHAFAKAYRHYSRRNLRTLVTYLDRECRFAYSLMYMHHDAAVRRRLYELRAAAWQLLEQLRQLAAAVDGDGREAAP